MPKRDTAKGLRINIIIDQLNKKTPYGGVTVRELAEKFEVTERTIYRDLKVIENDLVVPLVRQEDGRGSRIRLKHGYLPSLSPEKATVIFLSLLQHKGSALTGHIEEIKNALISTLFKYHNNPQKLATDNLQNRIHIIEESLADPLKTGEHFIKLVDAVRESYRVKLWYFVGHSGKDTERVVEPYGLICKRQNWYLVGRCLLREEIRVFRIDQISHVLAYTNERFKYPEDFSIQEYMAPSWGVINDGKCCQVLVKFSRPVAHLVQNMRYHSSQEIVEELEDGSLVVAYYVCGMQELKGWLILWGDSVEVLEPKELRQGMREFALRVAGLYGR